MGDPFIAVYLTGGLIPAVGVASIVAATSMAVIGGIAGFFAGSAVYQRTMKQYFQDLEHAQVCFVFLNFK